MSISSIHIQIHLEQIKHQSDLGRSHDVQKEGKLERDEVLTVGCGVAIVRPR
jgi:hypothetical protein